MIGILSFLVSIISVMMSLFNNTKLSSFIVAIVAIIIAVISAYYKDKKESGEKSKKDSRALEVGSIIISGATSVSYFIYLILTKM